MGLKKYYMQGLVVVVSSFTFWIIPFCAQAQSSQSDSIYAQAVLLYNAGKYKDAIPLFSQCDSLDQIQMDSLDTRRGIARSWLASCYFKNGDDLKGAITHTSYMLQPIDRRLSIESDAIINEASKAEREGNIKQALQLFIKAEEKEEQLFGKDCHWPGNTKSLIADLYLQVGDTASATNYLIEALENSLMTRGTVASQVSWSRAHKLLELYSAQSRSGFYTLIQNILHRAKGKIEPNMRHDLVMETEYLAWKKNTLSKDICRTRMQQALGDCEHIHGKSSMHFSYMSSVMIAFLCSIGDYQAALRCNDKALEHYTNGGSMTHLAHQTLQRDRMAILLGLGRIKEASELGRNILRNCSGHYQMDLFDLIFINQKITEYPLVESDCIKLAQFAPSIIFHPLPIVSPTDEALIHGPAPFCPKQYNYHTCLSLSVIDASLILTTLKNDSIRNQAIRLVSEMTGHVDSDDPSFISSCKEMPPIFDEMYLRYLEAVEADNLNENKVLEYRKSRYNTLYNNKENRYLHTNLNIDGDLLLHFAIFLLNDSLESNALPFYSEYLEQRQLFMEKPLDQLTPSEQRLRRRYLIDSKKHASEIKRLEAIRRKYF